MSELLKLNVNEHTEKKNGLTYLSWAWAWAKVLEIDPQAVWNAAEFNGLPCAFLPDSSALVQVTVTIKGHTKQCWLPVMNHRNQAIKNPDAFAVNTAIVRCLTKCISMHGLGLYIYAGEDLPDGEEPEQKDAGAKGAEGKPAVRHVPTGTPIVSPERMSIIADVADSVKQHMQADDITGAFEEAQGLTDPEERTALWKLLDSKTRSALKAKAEELKKEAGTSRA